MARETFFELRTIGGFVKVTAIDAETGLEVSIVGPAAASEVLLRANALRKLEAALRKASRPPA
jgi:hypothetical protein